MRINSKLKTGSALFLGGLCGLVASGNAIGAEMVTKITDVMGPIGANGYQHALVTTSNYQIYSVDLKNTQLIGEAYRAMKESTAVKIRYETDTLLDLEPTRDPFTRNEPKPASPYSWYVASQFATVADASKMMKIIAREKLKEHSECWQRAEYWTFDLFREYGVRSEKIFLFFTQPYREGRGQHHMACKSYSSEYDRAACDRKEFTPWYSEDPDSGKRKKYFLRKVNQWDFHVAPLVRTNEGAFVLDGAFSYLKAPELQQFNTREGGCKKYGDISCANHMNMPTTLERMPLSIDKWTNLFVNTHQKCERVSSYAEASRRKSNPYESADCLYLIVPMYYLGPDNLDSGRYFNIDTAFNSTGVYKYACKAVEADGCGHWDSENERAREVVESRYGD